MHKIKHDDLDEFHEWKYFMPFLLTRFSSMYIRRSFFLTQSKWTIFPRGGGEPSSSYTLINPLKIVEQEILSRGIFRQYTQQSL